MKKHLLFNQLFGTEGSPNQTGETLTRENRIGLMSYLRRTLMLLIVAFIGIGNVWGADPTLGTTAPDDTVTVHSPGKVAEANLITKWGKKYEVYFSNNAAKTSLLVGSNTSGTTQATGTNKWCNIGSSIGSSDNNVSTGFVVGEFAMNTKTSNNKVINVRGVSQSERQIVMVVSGYDSVAILEKTNDCYVYKQEYNSGTYGTITQLTLGHTANGSSHYKRSFALDKTKQYRLIIAFDLTGSSNKGIAAFSLCYTPTTSCTEAPAAPTGFAKTAVTATTATFDITDAANAASYDIYCSESSTDPTSGTTPTATGITTKTPTVTGLTAGTTYYAWVRAVCDGSHKSNWVALTGSTFTTKAQYTITYDKGANGTGSISAGTKTEGEDFTLSSSVFTRDSYAQTGWATSDGGSKAYDLGGTYSTDAATTLYPVWTATTTYTFKCTDDKTITQLESAGWSFNSKSEVSMSATEAFVNLVKTFTDHSINVPGTDGSGYDYAIAIAKSTDAYARFDLGQATTVTAVTGNIRVGTSKDFSITIKYLGSDGSTVLRTSTTAHSKTNWGTNAINDATPVANVKYIQIQGAGSWQIMDTLHIKYGSAVTCPGNYSFHTGTNEQSDWTIACFENGAETDERVIENFTIPTVPDFYVGWEGNPLANNMTARQAWNTDVADLGNGVMNGAMVLLPVQGTSKVGWAQGAVGTLRCWYGSTSKNQYVGFQPNGYAIMYGGNNYAFAETATEHQMETEVVTLPAVSTTYQMGIATADGYTTCAHSNAAEAISNMGVTVKGNGGKAIYLVPGSFNADGAKYAVYDVTNSSFDTDFMSDTDGDGIYVGYVGSNCSSMILCRMNSDATTSDLSSNNWDKRWNQTANIGISGDLAKKYTITNMTTWNECAYTTANMQPITGQKGKFRMWDNSADQNWYVHFIPYYVLSYDANGGSGTTAATERNSESSTLTVSVASNGFTAPEGYQFAGWNTAADGSGTAYGAGDSYTLSADATLYAQWECTTPTFGTNLSTSTVNYALNASASALTVAATAGSGTVSYQWYSNDENNTTTPTTLTGQTNASYTPSTTAAGTKYYYCVATNSSAGCSTTATSNITPVTVAKADISPTLSYTSTTLTVGGGNSSNPTVSGNTGNGGVTYSSSNTSVATVNETTGVVTPVAAGSATITATIAATTNYNGNTATATFTIEAADDDCDDPQTVVKTVLTSNTAGTTTGYNDDEFAGNPAINLPNTKDASNGYKLGSSGNYFYVKLKSGTFVAGDKIKVEVTTINDAYKVSSVAQTILDLYFYDGSSTHTLLHTITDVTAAGTYTYTLTAADITTLNNKAYIGVYRPSEGRTQNPFIKSIEVEGCREWTIEEDETAPTLVSSDPANGDDDVATSGNITLTFSENVTIVDASKFSLSGGTGTLNTASASASGAVVTIPYSGLANSTTYTLATAAGAVEDAAGNDNAALSSISFTTEAAGACPTGGDIFTLNMTYSDNSAIKVAANSTLAMTATHGTATGGSVTFGNQNASSTDKMQIKKTGIAYINGDDAYIKLDLTCPLKTGDVLTFTSDEAKEISFTTTDTRATSVKTSSKKWTVTSAFNNVSTIYIWRASSNSVNLHTINIVRPITVTFDKNGGSSVSPTTATYDGTSSSVLATPVRADYHLVGWNTRADGSGTDLGLPGETYHLDVTTNTATVYAKWVEKSCASGTIYKFQVATSLTNDAFPHQEEVYIKTSDYLANLTGGYLKGYNSSSSSDYLSITNNQYICIGNSGSYLLVQLDCPLQSGDKIKSTVTAQTMYVTKASDSRTSTVTLPTTANNEQTIPDALVGATELKIWAGSSNGGKISLFEIIREASTYTVTYNGNGQTSAAGTVPAADNNGGSGYAYNASVTTAAQGLLAKTNYTFGGWNTANNGTGTNTAAGNTFTITDNTTLYAKWTQAVTFDANTEYHGSTGGSATAVWNATALTGITHATPVSGYRLLGYYTTASGDGVKVLNSDGTFASSNVADYITSGKWSRTDEAPTLYARYESSGSLIWNLGVNTEATSLTTSSKESSFTQIAVVNMGGATLSGSTYTKSAKSSLTGKISSPAIKSDYVYVTFTVADGYKFTPSNISVKVQPVGENEHKAVELSLADATNTLVSGSATKCDGTSSGETTTVTLAGNGTYFTGTVTLKIYVYDFSRSATGTYRLGTPIEIQGEVEEACATMPSFTGMSYATADYTVGDTPGAISIEGGENINTYAWKQNTTNDRSGTTPASGTNNAASYTPPTSAAGTMYYWCEMTNTACDITIKSPAVAITVRADKSDASVTWTDPAELNYGGGGYVIRATMNSGYDGTLSAEDLTAPAGIRITNVSVNNVAAQKYIEATFDVTTAFNRDENSKISFTLSHDATTGYDAISDEHEVDYNACSGGGGSSYNIRVRKNYDKDASNNYRWVTPGAGEITYAVGSSISSGIAGTAMATVFDSIMSSDKQYIWVKTFVGNIKQMRLYVETSGANVSVSALYQRTTYAAADAKDVITGYSVVYDEDDDAENTGTKGQHTIDLIFTSALSANDIICVKFSSSKVKALGAAITEGSGGSLNTHLQWSGELGDGDIVSKSTNDAYFTYSASKITENTNTLGTITYSSSAPSVATVDATGKVSMVAAGSTTIKATLAASGCYKKAEISYTLNVSEPVCSIAAGTLTLTSGTESKCSSNNVTLTLTGFESGASIQWKDGDTNINDGGNYTIAKDGTTSTLTTDQEGTYSVMVTSGCSVRSNRITISNKSTEVHVTRLVKEWYIKNGRLTPDIALWQLGEGETFVSVTASDGWDAGTGLTEAELGEKVFYEKDGIVYLKGTEPKANAETVQNYTLTLTVNDGCANQTLTEEGKKITIHHQQNTDKHVLAFVVNGTEKGDWTAGVTADQTTNVGLYNAIAAQFDVQATNIYSTDDEQKLREYYSQYDILCITDYPNTKTKGVNSKSYVDAIGALIDIRPILTMEAYVSSLANWRAKGISGNPKSPTTRQYTMLLQCKDHEIFSGTKLTKVGEGDETMYRVSMVCDTLEDYKTLDATYGATLPHKEKESKSGAGDGEYNYGGKPALQGFTFTQEMSDNDLLPIGLIDDGAGNPLQVGIERQHNMEARLMVLGINSYAMERLTDDGERVVINALNYLMKKNAEDIADCSTSFVGGAEGEEKNWNNKDNWTGNTVPLPSQKVRILAECEVSSTVHALDVLIVTDGKYNHGSDNAAGKLTIKQNGALIVGGKIQAASAPAYNRPRATTPDRLLIETSSTNQAALIFDNEEAETQATVKLYSLGRKDGNYQYQYFAVPMEVVPVNPAFANETHGGTGIYTYVYEEASSGWTRRKYYDDLFAFEGLGITTKSTGAMNYTMTGNLASTATKEITLTHDGAGLNLVGNSWMAPIQIGALAEDNTDANITKTVYIYCAGRDAVKGAATSGVTETAGQWIAIPFEAAEFATWKETDKLSVIPAMQAFQIKVADEATLTLDYDKVVRGSTNDLNAKLRAPGRRMAANEVTMTNIRVADSKTHTDLSLFEGDRFSEAFDNGWEAEYMNGDGRSAKLYAETEAGQMAVAAMYDYEGTVVGFAPGQETEYTFSFMGEDNGYYLNDIKLRNSVRISEGETYTFTYEEGDAANRFYISRTAINAPEVATGMENLDAAAPKVQKIIYNDKLYIIRGGRLYDATGKVVK